MSVESLTRITLVLGCLVAARFQSSFAQEQSGPVVTFPSTKQENRTLRNEQQPPLAIGNKRNDWWPPAATPASAFASAASAALAPTPDQELTQPSIYQYSPWIQQPPMPASYYPPGQVRSEHYAYPPEYTEYSHSVVNPAAGNSLGLGPKHLAIVSFIGLLLLFAIIQNSLMSAKRKDALVDALSGRRKRDLYVTHGLRPLTPEQEEILNDDARLRCIQRTVCLENRRLMEDLGGGGEKLAKYLTSGVERSVITSSGWDRLIEDAGAAGLRGEDCKVLYRDCVQPVISRSRRNRKK